MRAGVIPAAIARQPWGIILPLTVLTAFGAAVLYSAAGGSLEPWALQHLIRFAVFLAMAMVIARLPKGLFTWAAYPAYGVLVVLLALVDLIGAVGGGSSAGSTWASCSCSRLN